MKRAPSRQTARWIPLVLAPAIVAAAAGSGRAKTGLYTDDTYGFSIAVPEFTQASIGEQVKRLKISGVTEGGFATNLTVVVLRKIATPQQYLAETKKAFASIKLILDSAKERQVSGHPALRVEYHGKMQDRDLHFLAVSVFRPRDVVTATCVSGKESVDRHRKECEASLASLKLSKAR